MSGRLGRHSRPLIMAASAALIAASLGGCGSDYQDDTAINCVKKVDPTAGDDDTEVEVVDPQYCDADGNYARSHGGGTYFISSGGGYYNTPVGARYVHSSSTDGGSRLVPSTDTAGRASVRAPSSFSNGAKTGSTTVRGGGFGSSGGKGAGG